MAAWGRGAGAAAGAGAASGGTSARAGAGGMLSTLGGAGAGAGTGVALAATAGAGAGATGPGAAGVGIVRGTVAGGGGCAARAGGAAGVTGRGAAATGGGTTAAGGWVAARGAWGASWGAGAAAAGADRAAATGGAGTAGTMAGAARCCAAAIPVGARKRTGSPGRFKRSNAPKLTSTAGSPGPPTTTVCATASPNEAGSRVSASATATAQIDSVRKLRGTIWLDLARRGGIQPSWPAFRGLRVQAQRSPMALAGAPYRTEQTATTSLADVLRGTPAALRHERAFSGRRAARPPSPHGEPGCRRGCSPKSAWRRRLRPP